MGSLHMFSSRVLVSLILSVFMAKRGYNKKSLCVSGAISAVVVGFFVTLANYSFSACLLTFYVTSSKLTNLNTSRKRNIEENFKEGGQRTWKQVLCNGGVALLVSIIYISEVGFSERPINFSKDFTSSILCTALVGSLACCNGDTWSSEIGTAVGSHSPRLVTTFQKVPAGTNGAISLIGTIASCLGGLTVGLAFFCCDYVMVRPSSFLLEYPPQWPILVLATFAGLVGSLVDSYLGAIFQYSGFCSVRKKITSKKSSTTKHVSGSDVLDNDLVNFSSSCVMAISTPLLGYYIYNTFQEL